MYTIYLSSINVSFSPKDQSIKAKFLRIIFDALKQVQFVMHIHPWLLLSKCNFTFLDFKATKARIRSLLSDNIQIEKETRLAADD